MRRRTGAPCLPARPVRRLAAVLIPIVGTCGWPSTGAPGRRAADTGADTRRRLRHHGEPWQVLEGTKDLQPGVPAAGPVARFGLRHRRTGQRAARPQMEPRLMLEARHVARAEVTVARDHLRSPA